MLSKQKRKLEEDVPVINDNKRRIINDDNKEENISKLISAVLNHGPLGKLVIMQDEDESPYVTLQNAVAYTNMNLAIVKNPIQNNIELQINGKQFAKGIFRSIQLAKRPLAEEALEKLKEICFFIFKKKNYVNVIKENLQASTSSTQTESKSTVDNDSIAHKIMLKMGWTGGGLGIQEQGNLDAVILSENINRQGFGTSNIMGEITKKLSDFSKSSELLTLVFDENFTKEERMLIHKTARKFNLKSKSTGTESRKLTVSRKITRIDIVKELLKIGGEDGLYKLHVPTKFVHIWENSLGTA